MAAHLTRVYQDQLKATRIAVKDGVGRVFKALPAYNRSDIPTFLHHAVPMIQAGQIRAAHLTSVYMSKTLKAPIIGLDTTNLVGAAVRNGVSPEEVYTRAFIQLWGVLKANGNYNDAIQQGLDRVQSSSMMDVALATRDAALQYGSQSSEDIIGWIRVADSDACQFCSDIDGAKTGPDEPMPLHNNCGCTVDPITSTSTTSNDAPTLDDGATVGDAEINMNDELGPVITSKGDNFTTPADFKH